MPHNDMKKGNRKKKGLKVVVEIKPTRRTKSKTKKKK